MAFGRLQVESGTLMTVPHCNYIPRKYRMCCESGERGQHETDWLGFVNGEGGSFQSPVYHGLGASCRRDVGREDPSVSLPLAI